MTSQQATVSTSPPISTINGGAEFSAKSLTMRNLLEAALHEPGLASAAYTIFHDYSLLNRLGLAFQFEARGMKPEPVGNAGSWTRLDRTIKRGCSCNEFHANADGTTCTRCNLPPRQVPFMVNHPVLTDFIIESEDGRVIRREKKITGFEFRPTVFSLSQTEGEDLEWQAHVGFDVVATLERLDITLVPFEMEDGNVQGYAKGRQVAVNPIAAFPRKTLFHEIAHVLLGHTTKEGHDQVMIDGVELTRNIGEAEAEATAYIVAACLEMDTESQPGSRDYIQTWLEKGQVEFTDASARRVFGACDKLLNTVSKKLKEAKGV